MLTYKRVLAAGTAVVLGAGGGFATSVFAQVAGQPSQVPGNPPTPVGQGNPEPAADAIGSNFRRDGTVTVMQRPREGYEARGMRVGTLLVFPKVTIAAEHSDNILASSINEKSDTIWRVQPEVSVNSDWSRHQLTVFARTSINRYQDNQAENTTDWGLGAAGRLDVTRATQVNGRLDYTRGTEPRSSPNAQILPPGTDPVQYDVLAVGLVARHEFNRLLVTGRLDSQKFEYDSPQTASGTIIDQSYRDRTVTVVGARLDYALSPATAMFADVSTNLRDVNRGTAASAIERSSDGYQALVGVNFEITALMRGDIGVGYMRQKFDNPNTKDLEGFSTSAQVAWLPTQLTTVTLNASRTIEDSAVPDAPGYLSTNLRGRVDHELLRNVILTGQVGYGKDEYSQLVQSGAALAQAREDRRISAGVGATYLINRTLGVSATYNYLDQETRKGVGSNFKENRVAATLTVQY